MADEVKIKISTEGDPKGADKVAKSLDKIEKQAGKTTKASDALTKAQDRYNKGSEKVSKTADGLRSRIAKLKGDLDTYKGSVDRLSQTQTSWNLSADGQMLPTLNKLKTKLGQARKAVQDFGGPLGELVNPANLAAAGVAAAVGVIVNMVSKIKGAMDDAAASATRGFGDTSGAVEKVKVAVDAAKTAVEQYSAAIDANNVSAATAVERSNQELAAANLLAEAQDRVALAKINRMEASGELSAEQAAAQRAILEETSAEEAYTRALEASQAILEKRKKTLEANRLELEKIEKLEAKARAELDAFDQSKDTRGRVAGIDPKLNSEIDFARKENQGATKVQGDLGSLSGFLTEASSRQSTAANANPITGLLDTYRALKSTWEDLQAANETEAESAEEFARLTAERVAAVESRKAEMKARADALASQRAGAASAVSSSVSGVQQAGADVRNKAGVGRQVLDLNNEANRIAAGVSQPSTPGASPDVGATVQQALSALPAIPEADQLARVLRDGLQARESALVGMLTQVIATETQATSGGLFEGEISELKRAVERLQSRVDQAADSGKF